MASQAFNLDSSLQNTDRVYYNLSNGNSTATSSGQLSQKIKVVKKNIPAIQIGGKLLVIKGYSEEASNVLIALEKENVTLNSISQSYSEGFTPTMVEVTVSEEVGTTVLEQEGAISEYEVVVGDTIENIAKKFNITTETILWANDLSKNSPIKVGQKLVILPVSGVSYKIRRGDTVSTISEKFHVSQAELTEFNNLEDGKLVLGVEIIIPGGKLLAPEVTKKSVIANSSSKVIVKNDVEPLKDKGFMSRPVSGGIRTQGIHGHNGIDIAAQTGTPILAAASGNVSLVRGGDGWNGGYGNYVVITHENGVQTLYAHMSAVDVLQGQNVSKGQKIGGMGNTGQSTGTHLHFEVRGAKNPF